jgi:hypothetical protein
MNNEASVITMHLYHGKPELVGQSVEDLTADQKVWGLIPTQARAKRGYVQTFLS